MPIYAIDGLTPVVDPSAFVHPTAVLIGDVIVGPGCYVAPLASLRGDFGRIVLEAGSNIQDCCVLHGYPSTDTVVGRDGHVGHAAVLHGCAIARDALIGMNTTVMDGANIGEQCIVAANAFVKAGFEAPPRTLVAGVPARVVRELHAEEIAWKQAGTRDYQELTRRSLRSLIETQPLREIEPGRPRLQVSDLEPLHKSRS